MTHESERSDWSGVSRRSMLLGITAAAAAMVAVSARAQEVLPYPEQKFRGNVGTTYKDSDPAKFPTPIKAPAGAPNVLVVLLDDVGYGQFSVSGGGVPSPKMEELARNGVFYSRFHTTALCSPTRAALLTGRNHHVAGTGIITELATGYDGYTGIIPKDTATVAEILRQNGYITAWFGKNHNTPIYETSMMGPFDHWPNGLGFDHFYGFMAGDTNQIRPFLYENQVPMAERPKSLPAWDTLNSDQKRLYSRMMEAFAAYGYQVDQEVGRVLDYVASLPDADNTLIIYIIGDNGASAEGGLDGTLNENAFFNNFQMTYQQMLAHIDEIGTEKHFNHFPAEWAWAMDTPFQWTKQIASHLGGTRNPMIVKWPARYKPGGQMRNQFVHVIDIVPTILEAARIDEPNNVNGTPQTPIQGRSFLGTLSDGKAPEIRTSQYFEIFANRAMYKDGWWAASLAFEPWQSERTDFDPLTAKWELYDLSKDYSQAHDLAKEHPDKLAELTALWWAEASANKALPLDWRGAERFSAELTGKPNLSAGRTKFVYPGVMSGLPEASAPDLKNKSFSVSAKVQVDDRSNGMIFTQGGNTGGWAFYLKEGKLVVVHNYIDVERLTVSSQNIVPAGKRELAMDFAYHGQGKVGQRGTVTLFVDGKQVGTGRIEKTTPYKYSLSENQDIGTDTGTPVTYDYKAPFTFEGKLEEVTVELKQT
jgi:arylsulfatase A-like enzyme